MLLLAFDFRICMDVQINIGFSVTVAIKRRIPPWKCREVGGEAVGGVGGSGRCYTNYDQVHPRDIYQSLQVYDCLINVAWSVSHGDSGDGICAAVKDLLINLRH